MKFAKTILISTVAHFAIIAIALNWYGFASSDHAFGLGLVVGTVNSLITTILMLSRHMPLVLDLFGWEVEQ